LEITGELLRHYVVTELAENIRKTRKHFNKTIHLSHILYCPHKTRYRSKTDFVDEGSAIAIHRGKATEKYLIEIFKRKYPDLKDNKPFTVFVELGDDVFEVWMTPDIWIGDVIVELKTVKALRRDRETKRVNPYEHHYDQIANYIHFGGARMGILFYYEVAVSKITTFDIPRTEIDPNVMQVHLEQKVLNYMFPPARPEPRYEWECLYCDKHDCPFNKSNKR